MLVGGVMLIHSMLIKRGDCTVLGVSHKSGPIAQPAAGKGAPLTLVPEYDTNGRTQPVVIAPA